MSIYQQYPRAHTQADRKRYQDAGLQTKLKPHNLDDIKCLSGFVLYVPNWGSRILSPMNVIST